DRGAGSRLERERGGHRARERAPGLPVDVLCAHEQIAALAHRQRGGFDRHRGREEPDVAVVAPVVAGAEGLEVAPGVFRAEMHLPVGGEQQPPHASSRAATPGRGFPSRNSSDAPPPVDTWVSLLSNPATAATESPPPTTVVAPRFPASTSASAMARVPSSNGGVSNTPIGPFQKIVLARSSRARKSCCVVGSMSKTAQPLGIASAATARFSLARWSDGAITPPRGRISFLPLVASSS